MGVSAQRATVSYSPMTVSFQLENAATELAYRDFISSLNMEFIRAVLEASDTDTATEDRALAVWQQFQEQIQAMAPHGVPAVE